MPKAVQVGSELPVTGAREPEGQRPARRAEPPVLPDLLARRQDSRARRGERTTNTLGTAYLHLTAIELPGFYKLAVYASKGRHRGQVTRTFKVRRR